VGKDYRPAADTQMGSFAGGRYPMINQLYIWTIDLMIAMIAYFWLHSPTLG